MTPTDLSEADRAADQWLDILAAQGFSYVRYRTGRWGGFIEFYVCHRCGAMVPTVVPIDMTVRPVEAHIRDHGAAAAVPWTMS